MSSSNGSVEVHQESSSGKLAEMKNGRPATKKRLTHFLCFPLVTETSVPQLATALSHFREVTTKPPRRRKEDGENGVEQDEVASDDDGDLLRPNANHSISLPQSYEELQIIPASAHREPGTFHLTLGVMDLSEQAEMNKALSLLQQLDYAEIFQEVFFRQQEETRLATTSSTESSSPAAFSSSNPPVISLTGLSTFPSAKNSQVFWTKPVPSPSGSFPLLQFGQAIRRKFREAGLITDTRPLVLHATVANMKYAVQPKGGRTSKGKAWRYGKQRWTENQLDARETIKCFELHGGSVEEYIKGKTPAEGEAQEFVWAAGIVLNRVAICTMGALKSDDEVLGKVYPPVSEKLIFS